MTFEVVRAAYSARAAEYTSLFGSISSTQLADQQLILAWASGLSGKVLDAGCGPGQWTSFLHSAGIDVEGVDVVPEFIAAARQNFPQIRFAVGSFERLPTKDQSLAGILAWYSLIHIPPAHIGGVLDQFAQCIKPGGGLLLGFFDGPDGDSFPHAVTPAYFWSVEGMSARLVKAGFTVAGADSRIDPGVRPHAAIAAIRTEL